MTQAGLDQVNSPDNASANSMQQAFETVECTLKAENWFFETVRKELQKVAPLSEFPTITGSNGHDYMLHLTQFLFFLNALDCRSTPCS